MRKLTWAALTAGTSVLAGAALVAGVASGYGSTAQIAAPAAQTVLTAKTFHGCLSSGRIIGATLDSAVSCGHGSVPVKWRGPVGAGKPSPSGSASGSAAAAIYHGCLAGGWITAVTAGHQPGCKHGARPVHWRGQPGGVLPSPSVSPTTSAPSSPASMPTSASPDPTTPSPVPASTASSSAPPSSPSSPPSSSSSPSASPTGKSCVSSAADGGCGPYLDSQIAASDGSSTFVNNDVWSPIPGWSQTLTSFGPGSWQAVANMPAGNTAIGSYPDVQQLYNDVNLSSYTSMTSSFTENMNANPGTVGEAAWDIWLTNWNYEVMIWVDNYGQDIANSDDTLLGTTSIGGQTWDVYRNGPLGPGVELIVALDHNEQSSTVNIMSTLNYLQQHSWLPSNATLTAVDFGAEFASTGGKNETFQVSNYTINARS